MLIIKHSIMQEKVCLVTRVVSFSDENDSYAKKFLLEHISQG